MSQTTMAQGTMSPEIAEDNDNVVADPGDDLDAAKQTNVPGGGLPGPTCDASSEKLCQYTGPTKTPTHTQQPGRMKVSRTLNDEPNQITSGVHRTAVPASNRLGEHTKDVVTKTATGRQTEQMQAECAQFQTP